MTASRASGSLSYCARQAQAHDNDRFVCALFAPEQMRESLFAILAFNSEVARIRETVHEALLGEIRLQWWRETLDSIFAGQAPRHEVATALAAAVARHGLPRAPFDRLIEGRVRDLYDEEPDTLSGLLAYVGETAEPLAELELVILGATDAASLDAARHVATAFALTGLLRAIGHHARQGRLYLPKDVMAQAGLARRTVLELRRDPALAKVALQIAGIARQHLAHARGLRPQVSRRALPALLPGLLAGVYLDRLARAANDPLAPSFAAARRQGRLRLMLAAIRGRF